MNLITTIITGVISCPVFGQDICHSLAVGWHSIMLKIDSLFFSLVSVCYKVFILICNINYNSIFGITSTLIQRVEALIIVFVVYRLGTTFIKFMVDPDQKKVMGEGTKLLKNIAIVAALLVSYNFIFTVINEIGILIIGNEVGYKYTALSQVFDLNDADGGGKKDPGLIIRALYGNEEFKDPGESLAQSVAGMVIRNRNCDARHSTSNPIDNSLCQDGPIGETYSYIGSEMECDGFCTFGSRISEDLAWHYAYHIPILGIIIAIFIAFVVFKQCIEVGIRLFKLIILQIVAPIAIVRILDEGVDGEGTKGYIHEYFSVFASAFVRMITLLVVTTLVAKFVSTPGQFFPTLVQGENWFVSLLLIVAIIFAAYTFVAQVPAYIDKLIRGKNATTKEGERNFLGAALGGVTGAIGGAIGGAVGGGAGGALAGAASGLKGGFSSGLKGKKVADIFKNPVSQFGTGKGTGATVKSAGGLKNYARGQFQNVIGGPKMDRQLASLDRQQALLDDYNSAVDYEMKDEKLSEKSRIYDVEGNDIGSAANHYSEGFQNVKMGTDKDAYAAQMLNYDKDYQKALSAYDAARSDETTINNANTAYNNSITSADAAYNTDFSSIQTDYADDMAQISAQYDSDIATAQSDVADYQATIDSYSGDSFVGINNDGTVTFRNSDGKEQTISNTYKDDSGTTHTISSQADFEAFKQSSIAEATKLRDEAQTRLNQSTADRDAAVHLAETKRDDAIKAAEQKRDDAKQDAKRVLDQAKTDREKLIEDRKIAAQESRSRAEERAKEQYEVRKAEVQERSRLVSKRATYENAGGKISSKTVGGKKYAIINGKEESKEITKKRNEIKDNDYRDGVNKNKKK